MQDNQGSSHGQHTSIRMQNVVSSKAQFETLERIRGSNGHNSPRSVSYVSDSLNKSWASNVFWPIMKAIALGTQK